MSPFLRIGLSNFDCGSCQPCQGEAVNPYCAVLVKEYVESGKLVGCGREAGTGGRPCYELGSKTFWGLQGRLVQPNFAAQETDAQGSQVLPQGHVGLEAATELDLRLLPHLLLPDPIFYMN